MNLMCDNLREITLCSFFNIIFSQVTGCKQIQMRRHCKLSNEKLTKGKRQKW